jgi:hypothetical protein
MATNPLIVALGRAVPLNRNVEVAQINHGLLEAELEMKPLMTLPRLFWPANRHRESITIYAPVDGPGVYIGGDATVTEAWGTFLPPGQAFKLLAYYGPLWVISRSGLHKAYVVET